MYLVTHNDGREVIYKSGSSRQIDAEFLGAAVGRGIGAPVPRVVMLDESTVAMERVQGITESTARQSYGDEHLDRIIRHTRGGRLLGVLDVLLNNTDRYPTNIVFMAGAEVSGFDHGMAFSRAPLQPRFNPFIEGLIRGGLGGGIIDHPLSRRDVELIRGVVEGLRPEFVRLERSYWYDEIMGRIDELAEHATGTQPLYDDAHPIPGNEAG